jgi:hypothetical protein
MRTSGARASGYTHKNYSPAMPVQIPRSNRQVENMGGFAMRIRAGAGTSLMLTWGSPG